MALKSAGLLMCRRNRGKLEFFLIHPGGPFFAKKNEGFWTIPKGLPEGDEDLLVTATREFTEETGLEATPPFYPLGYVTQKGGKVVYAWSFLGSWDEGQGIVSNEIKIEWPPRSGKFITIPEADKAEWMEFGKASQMINPKQLLFLEKAILHYKNNTDEIET